MNYLDVVEGPHSNDAVRRSRQGDVHRVPLVQLRETDAEDVLRRAVDMTHQGIDAGQRITVDGPEVEPSAGTGSDVTRQVVDVPIRQPTVVVHWIDVKKFDGGHFNSRCPVKISSPKSQLSSLSYKKNTDTLARTWQSF